MALLGVPHASVCGPAAALLLTLTADSAGLEALATEAFFHAAAQALKASPASDGEDTLKACVCVLLQKLSTKAVARPLYATGGLRGTLLSITHSSGSDFVLANAKSILTNTAE